MFKSILHPPAAGDAAVGKYQVKELTVFRRLLTESLDAIPPSHSMMALLEIDITEPRKTLANLKESGHHASLFAFVVKSIATALTEHRELNSMRSGNRVIEFEDIDINVPVELDSSGEKTPRQVVIRNAACKSVEEIWEEIHAAKERFQTAGNTGEEDQWALSTMQRLFILPKFLLAILVRTLQGNPFNVKRMSGTTFVTSVTMPGISGFAVPYIIGPRAVSFALGSVVKKPAVVDQEIMSREILSMTVVFNHDIVDGAPAARFARRLKELLEGGAVLTRPASGA